MLIIPNRITAKEARVQGESKAKIELIAELTEIYDKVRQNKKDGEITLYNRNISDEAREILSDEGYMIVPTQTGMNEYSTTIKW